MPHEPAERTHERRVFCARDDRRVMLFDARSVGVEYEPARARLDSETDVDGLTPVRLDPEASWSPIAYRRSDAGVAVVTVCGPLEHHGGWWFDSYESIRERVACALADDAVRALVLRIDSPGGVANGMVDTARDIRARAEARDVPVYAFADEQMTSAAFGLACAADEIWCPETGEVGSVGVLLPVADFTRANEKAGIRTKLITTGSRKGDGHPYKPLTTDAVDALQTRVDAIGDAFFALVAAARGMKVAAVSDLEAGVFIGEAAKAVGFVDGVSSWAEFLGTVESSVGGRRSTGLDKSSKSGTTLQQRGSKVTQETEDMKLLDLIKAKDAADAALKKATALDDRKKREKAVDLASAEVQRATEVLAKVATYDAKSKMWKKTTKIEEEEEDTPSKSTSTPASTGGSTGAEEEEDASSEKEDDESEEEERAASSGKPSAYSGAPRGFLKDGMHSARSLRRLVCQLTNDPDLPSAMDKLAEMGAKAAAYGDLQKRVAKLETNGESSKVKALVDDAIKEGRAFKAQRESLIAMGMRDRKQLKSFLDASPKRIATSEADLAQPNTKASPAISGLTAKQAEIAHATATSIAKMTGRDFDEVLREVVDENKKIAAAPQN